MMIDNSKINEDVQSAVEDLMSGKFHKIYLLGRNENARVLSRVLKVDGYIDDYTNDTTFLEKPIYKSSDIDTSACVVSCSMAIYPHSALKTLRNNGIKNILDYLEVSKHANDTRLRVLFIDDAKKDLEENLEKYESIYKKMSDVVSKETFHNIVNFRFHKDLDYLKEYEVDEIGQYFEDFLNLGKGEVFVDAGGYDGQTSIEFIKHCPEYKAVYIFEPDQKNLSMAKENLASYENINFMQKGLSDAKATLRFNTGSGSASSISETGNVEIEVDTLDHLVKEKVTFIKMDIEGAEGSAIEGMKGHILNDHPKMAISVYHKVDDFWKIPEQILAIRNDYDLYMRHYTEGTDETVMFFMPKNESLIKDSK